MDWLAETLDRLAANPVIGYDAGGPAFSEPTALAALALLAQERTETATGALDWLAELQAADGGVGISAQDPLPYWPTSQSVVAWSLALAGPLPEARATAYRSAIERGLRKMHQSAGLALEQTEIMGHDMSIVGWPWVDGTHSWSEPTAWQVMALRANGQGDSVRARDGVRMIVDRLLPGGGSNYGNTYVLGQQLRPHLQPTGIVLMALAGERDPSGRLERSLDFLAANLNAETPTASLCYGLMGLATHGRLGAESAAWLAAAHRRTLARGARPLQLALLAWAAACVSNPAAPPPGVVVAGATSQ